MSESPFVPHAPRDGANHLRVEWHGEVSYAEGLRLQEEAIAQVRDGEADRLLLLEHPPVITLGRASKRAHVLLPEDMLAARGIELIEVARGGDVTYHGRGQLVGYLISNLRGRGRAPDVHRFVRDVEACLIDAVGAFGLAAHRVAGRAGVYVPPPAGAPVRKLASVGVGVRHWISHHGFALNVDIDLREFDVIVPCGLDDIEMTSLEREGVVHGPEFALRTRRAVAGAFTKRFGRVALGR